MLSESFRKFLISSTTHICLYVQGYDFFFVTSSYDLSRNYYEFVDPPQSYVKGSIDEAQTDPSPMDVE